MIRSDGLGLSPTADPRVIERVAASLAKQGYTPAQILRFVMPHGGCAYGSMDAPAAGALKAVLLASGFALQVRPRLRVAWVMCAWACTSGVWAGVELAVQSGRRECCPTHSGGHPCHIPNSSPARLGHPCVLSANGALPWVYSIWESCCPPTVVWLTTVPCHSTTTTPLLYPFHPRLSRTSGA